MAAARRRLPRRERLRPAHRPAGSLLTETSRHPWPPLRSARPWRSAIATMTVGTVRPSHARSSVRGQESSVVPSGSARAVLWCRSSVPRRLESIVFECCGPNGPEARDGEARRILALRGGVSVGRDDTLRFGQRASSVEWVNQSPCHAPGGHGITSGRRCSVSESLALSTRQRKAGSVEQSHFWSSAVWEVPECNCLIQDCDAGW
jgi:hypothetical protein